MALLFIILSRLVTIYSYILIAYALMSWLPGAYNSAIGRLLRALAEPVLNPFRKLRLQFFGLDFTIIFVLFLFNIGLQILAAILF
ncbi:YggT family protein [Streptococcus loxodontisalivarius]|uniref:YggT family protein n=1 Tax=Streptococcus loxodontisalivarius TaxID=1349415 RepID=A0ABS2PRE1_9STRE|nr:YggT family protein [Streptococcus loxodontisalivarius]MBM7642618.1 YggT family protein [Streptococcus loxodontisalivarius]